MDPRTAAHDVRTQLHASVLSLRTLCKKVGDDPALAAALRSAEEQSRRATEALEHFIDSLSLSSAPSHRLTLQACTIGEVVTAAVTRVSQLVAAKDQSIVLPADLSRLPSLFADRSLLVRALVHLLENAVKFGAEGQPIHLTVRLRRNDGHPALVVTVTDHGPGLAPAVADGLLLPGNLRDGLGLASAREIIEAHGGRLWVEINPPPGAAFSFSLPLAGDSPSSAAGNSLAHPAGLPALRDEKQRSDLASRDQTLGQQRDQQILEQTSAQLGRRIDELQAANLLNDDSRRAALDLLEDAVQAREQAERANEALRESEARLRLVIENAREYVIFSADLERRVTTWNVGAERILGYSEKEILGQPADVIFTPEDRAAGLPEKETITALAEGRASDERWHIRKNGERFWGSGVMMAMRNAAGEAVGLVKIFRDETESRHVQQALEASRQQLIEALRENEAARAAVEASSQAKDHFLALLSHELRTPLAPILLALKILARQADLSPSAHDKLDLIRRNIQIETLLIDDLLDMTRIEHGKLEISLGPVDLHQVINRALEVTAGEVESKRQKVTVSLAASPHHLSGDATRLQQVVWNLLKNASKFTPEHGDITISTRLAEGRIILVVHDSGVGIAPNALSRIFDAFAQGHPGVTRQFGGLGLGLAISKAIVEAHHGRIHAASDGPGRGSSFTVELPLDPAQAHPLR